jgi:hypothetical protein
MTRLRQKPLGKSEVVGFNMHISLGWEHVWAANSNRT